jgi:phosphoribosylpyrophosphate synthetase
VLGGGPAIVTSVPSTREMSRLGRHPLETAVTRVGALARFHQPLLARGPAHADHNVADDDVFSVRRRLSGERVLVIDDTFTTGARLQSAVSALRLSGASAVACVVVGRIIDPEWNENCRQIWDQARATPFSFAECCLCRS